MFSWVNRADAGSLTASSQAPTLPVQNLTDKRVQKVWRALTTSANFGVDFGSAVSTRLLALFGCNLAAADTVRHRLSAVSPGAGELLDTGVVACGVQPGYAASLYLLSAAVNARYWQCDIVATSRAAFGTFDIGRAWAGAVWAPTISFAYGWSEGWQDTSEAPRSRRSGTRFNDDGAQFRKLNVKFECLSDTDKTQALELDRYAGKRGQVLFLPDSTLTLATTSIFGRMTDVTPITEPAGFFPSVYAKDYEIEQDL